MPVSDSLFAGDEGVADEGRARGMEDTARS